MALKCFGDFRKMVFSLVIFAAVVLVGKTQAQVGSPDPAYGNNGVQNYAKDPGISGRIVKVLANETGSSFVIYQYTLALDSRQRVAILKYLPSGKIDTSYGLNGLSSPVLMSFTDAAINTNGKIVLAGNTAGTNYSDFHDDIIFALYKINGSLDNSFSGDGIQTRTISPTTYDYVKSVSFQGDKVIIAGYYASLTSQIGSFFIDRYNANGSFSNSFAVGELRHSDFFAPYPYAQAVISQGDKIVVAGYVANASSGNSDFSIYRYNANGSFDLTFNGTGKTTVDFGGDDYGYAIAIQNDKILVAGSYWNLSNSNASFAVARFNDNGTADNSFNTTGKQIVSFGTMAEAASVALQGGKIILGGYNYNAVKESEEFAIARLTDFGSVDLSFDLDGKQTTGDAMCNYIMNTISVGSGRLFVSGVKVMGNNESLGTIASYIIESTGILPLQLLSFKANLVNDKTELSWKTVNEVNTKSFEVEVSTNTLRFTAIGLVKAIGTGGSTYSAVDLKPQAGNNYYRLKMTDIDGTVTYSEVVLIKVSGKQRIDFTIYPNPVAERLYINATTASVIQVNLYNQQGQRIISRQLAGGTGTVEVANLAKGVYIVQMISGDITETRQIIKK